MQFFDVTQNNYLTNANQLVTPLDIYSHLQQYFPFITNAFARSIPASNGRVVSNPTLNPVAPHMTIVYTMPSGTSEYVSVGKHYHLQSPKMINPCLSSSLIKAGNKDELWLLNFENPSSLITPTKPNDEKTIDLVGNWASYDVEVVEVVQRTNEVIVLVSKRSPSDPDIVPFEGYQTWDLDSETAWCELIDTRSIGMPGAIEETELTFIPGDGMVYPCSLVVSNLVLSQNLYIVDTPERVAKVYADNLKKDTVTGNSSSPVSPIVDPKLALFITFGGRDTLSSKDSDAGLISNAQGFAQLRLNVVTDVDLFVVWANNSRDEAHGIPSIEASGVVYSILNAALFGLNIGKTGSQLIPTSSGYTKSTDMVNYIHQYSYQARDNITISQDGLYMSKLEAVERLLNFNSSINTVLNYGNTAESNILTLSHSYP